MIDDMISRQFSQETQRNHLRDVGRFTTLLAGRRTRRQRTICAGSRSGRKMTAFRSRP
ncbi:hypothetical protein MPLB_1990059 [Mesorhizobium sp. ORS 3324]|nr:hypothetical protein MPLB_1990059 [Mesorhizobium sp. ORS 3324]